MLRDYVGQNCTPPGTGTTITLGNVLTGRNAFSAAGAFANGASAFCYLSDGTQWEASVCTLVTGSPDTLTGRAVIANSAGTTSRLNFTGTCYVYNDLPALRAVYQDPNGNVGLPGGMTIAGDPNFYLAKNNGAPTLNFSPNYYVQQVGGDLVIGSLGTVRRSFSNANALTIQQSGAASASALDIALSNISSFFAFFFYGATPVGAIGTNGSTTFYGTTSDYRTKVTFGPADTGALIDSVTVQDAEMKYGDRRPMFIAHELQAAAPWAVTGEKDAVQDIGAVVDANGITISTDQPQPDPLPPGYVWTKTGTVPIYQQVDHTALVPALWAELKALRARVATLEAH